LDTTTLIYGLVIIGMGFPLFYFGYLFVKKSQNEKLCRGAFACMFRGPDKAWVRLLPAKNGIIQKPKGKYLLKKEKNINIPWPEAGYVIPTNMRIPPIKWPINASPYVQAIAGLLVYDIGNPMPREYKTDSPLDPDTINNIQDSKAAADVFDTLDNNEKQTKKSGKLSDLVPWIAIIGIGIVLILVFIMYTNINTMAGDLNNIKNGMGY
jgi:hypothetical protein